MEIMDSLARSARVDIAETMLNIRNKYPEFRWETTQDEMIDIVKTFPETKESYAHKITCHGKFGGRLDDLAKQIYLKVIFDGSVLCDGDRYLYEIHKPCKIMFVLQSTKKKKYNVKIEFFFEKFREGIEVLKKITVFFKEEFVIKNQ